VIYLGEEHRNHWHIEAALKILNALIENHRHPLLAMEMFGWDGQAALNQSMTDASMSRAQFLDASHWQQNWGGAYEDYEPLVSFVSRHHLPLLALNPPRPLVRKVATQGLHSAMNDPDMAAWGMKDQQIVEDEQYREVILRQLQLCHGGLPASAYERMYEASMFRDEGMAKTIADALRSASTNSATTSGPIISYTGGGHIQYQLPIPNRVLRNQAGNVKQKSVSPQRSHRGLPLADTSRRRRPAETMSIDDGSCRQAKKAFAPTESESTPHQSSYRRLPLSYGG
jgi:uncharacterized iron-regulated protein